MLLYIPETLSIEQPTIRVSVRYYDENEQQLFSQYPNTSNISRIVADGVDIPTDEFLTYYLFHRKRPGKEGWRTYEEVGQKIYIAVAGLSEWLDFNGESISLPHDIGKQEIDITEHIGESIGLSVVNRIHDMTAADWDRIPTISGRKGVSTFDYQIASDGTNIIQKDGSNALQVETKGSSVENNDEVGGAIQAQWRRIKDKKQKIKDSKDYPYQANLRYGTISVIGTKINAPARCLLVDPPAEGNAELAGNLRLLLRMRFLRDWITFISPRSPFSAAIQTRLSALETITAPFELNRVSLLRGSGEPFEFADINGHSSFFAVKSKVRNEPIGGVVVPLPKGGLFFLGVRDDLVNQASSQNFDEIINYVAPHGEGFRTVECVLPTQPFQEYGLPENIQLDAIQNGGYFTFELKGRLFFSNSGIVFGALPTD